MMQYMCKYSPIELVKAFGTDVELPNSETDDLTRADNRLHSNLCAHARQLFLAAQEAGEVILTNCCDSVRRVYDTLGEPDRKPELYMLDLPHTDDGCAVRQYARQLKRFCALYEEKSGRLFDRECFLREWMRSSAAWHIKRQGMGSGPYVAILGARVSEGLLIDIRKRLRGMTVLDLTCLGFRDLDEPPQDAASLDGDALIEAYAAALLHQMPCMRMTGIASRRRLTEDPNLRGVVYNTIRFCDYYDFEYASIRGLVSVPVLKIESDYTRLTRGQLITRLQAFAEQFEVKETVLRGDRPDPDSLYVGIDSGSTTTNAVAIDAAGEIKASVILRTGPKASAAAEEALNELARQTGIKAGDFAGICATGYGRLGVPHADMTKTEITCHARGAHILDPSARCVIDIGGQDSKVICLGEDGAVTGFVMNDKCAAGTGRFLELMADTLQLEMAEMDRVGLGWHSDLTISSTCTVFAESEVISLIAEDKETADIIHGLNKAVAAKTYSLVKRAGGQGPFMMTGGVARNPGLVREIEEKLGEKLTIPDQPDLAGAIGAALFALDEGR